AAMGNIHYNITTCNGSSCQSSSPSASIQPTFPADAQGTNYAVFYSGALREGQAAHATGQGANVAYCASTPPDHYIEDTLPSPRIRGVLPGHIISYDLAHSEGGNPEFMAAVTSTSYGVLNNTNCEGDGYFIGATGNFPALNSGDEVRIQIGEGD